MKYLKAAVEWLKEANEIAVDYLADGLSWLGARRWAVALVAVNMTVAGLFIATHPKPKGPQIIASGGMGGFAAPYTLPSQLKYNANVTGSVSRPISSKLGDVVGVLDFAKCDGTTDDSTAFANMAALGARTFVIDGAAGMVCIVNTSFAPQSGSTWIGFNRPQLKSNVNGQTIMLAANVSNVTITGIRFKGSSGTTVPTGGGCGSYSPVNNGLVTLCNATDVRIEDDEFDTFSNGVAIEGSTRAWISKNKITNWNFVGILASSTSDFTLDHNTIQGCLQAGAVPAYGIAATGDQNGGTTQFRSSISFNKIKDVPSWDGIGTHDVDGLQVIGNDIRNVRNGIDIGHFVSTNFVSKIIVNDNYVEATTTDTWATAAASMFGIGVAGFDSAHQVGGIVISGNVVQGFFAVTGLVTSGFGFGGIVVAHTDRTTITGNTIRGMGGIPNTTSGIYSATSTLNGLTIVGNAMQGSMPAGAIRIDLTTADEVTIAGNTMQQTTSTDAGVRITSSTINNLALGINSTNSSNPFVQTSDTMTMNPFVMNTGSSIGDTANTGGTILNFDTRTGNPASNAADYAVIQFFRGGSRKWAFGLNQQGANDDGFDFNINGSTRIFGLTQTGVRADASGFKHKRGTAGCATAAAVGALCTTVVTWTTAFADANYTAVCNGRVVTSGVPVSGGFTAQVAASVTFETVATTAAAAQYTNIDCVGIHD